MARRLLIITMIFIMGCGKNPSGGSAPTNATDTVPSETLKTEEFFVKWFESHGHSDVVVDGEGVGVGTNATRLKASLYDSKQHPRGGFVVELEFTIQLPSRQKITEFVAGAGYTDEEAVKDAQLNFLLTTFHVVYKGFINPSDPHLIASTVKINGSDRQVIMGDLLMRGPASKEKMDANQIRMAIKQALGKLQLSPTPHWVKILYSQKDSKPLTVAATLDNQDQNELTNAVKEMQWPRRDGYYTAKQFVVIK